MSLPRQLSSSHVEDPTKNDILDRRVTIRGRSFQWATLAKLNIVSQNSIQLLQQYDDANAAAKTSLIESRGMEIMDPLVDFVANVLSLDASEYILTVVDEVIELFPDSISLLPTITEKQPEQYASAFAPFLRRLDHQSDYVAHQAARIIAKLVNSGCVLNDSELSQFLRWARSQITTEVERIHGCKLALSALASVLRVRSMRQRLFSDAATMRVMESVLDPSAHTQIIYQTLFLLWIASFDAEAVQGADMHALVLCTIHIITENPKEKVLRMAFGFIKNVVTHLDTDKSREMLTLMISHKILPLVENLQKGAGEDDDQELLADVDYFVDKLRAAYEHMSTFDEYVAEVRSGKLEWSPVHRSQRFWRENATKLNDNDHSLLKLVVTYLEKADDPLSIAVAIHDCGEYVSNYPFGRKILTELNAKAKIIALMEHQDPAIKYEALIAVQKMISDNWEFLGQQTNKIAAE